MAIQSLLKPKLATALLAASATFTLSAAGVLAAGQDPSGHDPSSHDPSSHDPSSSTQATDTSTPASSDHEESARLGRPPRADIKPFESAKLSLTQAITSAQRENRGKPLAARFEMWHGKPVYVIRPYSADQIWETRIDANTGGQIGQPDMVSKSQLGPQLDKALEAFNSSQTSLSDAVNKAEHDGGKVIMAQMKPVTGGASYDMDVVKNGHMHTAMVDAQSGQLR